MRTTQHLLDYNDRINQTRNNSLNDGPDVVRRKVQTNQFEVDDGRAAYNTNAHPRKIPDPQSQNESLHRVQIPGAYFLVVNQQIEALYDVIVGEEWSECPPLDALWLFTKVLQQQSVRFPSKLNHETLITSFVRLIETDDLHTLTVVLECLLAYLQKID